MLSAAERAASEKMTVLVVEPMKEPYVKEIDPDLHSLQAEVGGDIGATYPYSDPVALVCNEMCIRDRFRSVLRFCPLDK